MENVVFFGVLAFITGIAGGFLFGYMNIPKPPVNEPTKLPADFWKKLAANLQVTPVDVQDRQPFFNASTAYGENNAKGQAEKFHALRGAFIAGGEWIINNGRKESLHYLVNICHQASRNGGWYNDPKTGQPIKRNIPEMLALIHSEVSEALEGWRKDLLDDKLKHRPMMEVELADAIIRIADLAGYMEYDLGGAIYEKIEFNATRADHKPENRAQAGGKKC